MQCGFVGCGIHRFQLPIKNVVFKNQEVLLDKVDGVMAHIGKTKPAAVLREKTKYVAKIRNDTRWSSTTEVVKRYIQVHPHLDLSDAVLRNLMLNHQEFADLVDLHENCFKECLATTKLLQRRDQHVDLAACRIVMETMAAAYPDLGEYILKDAKIIKQPNFENGTM